MELVEFSSPIEDPEVRSYVQGLDQRFLQGPEFMLDFGFLAKENGKFVGRLLLGIRPVKPILMGELDLLALRDTAKPELESRSEAFVVDFEVEPAFRRRGIGTALQRAALSICRERGLYQMRSWSSYDSPENYRIKLRMGFAAVPGVQWIQRISKWVAGVYFVMPLTEPGD
ncbi:MAG: GNAT family N-acetyltransferase [Fimbriimonadales bacterium]